MGNEEEAKATPDKETATGSYVGYKPEREFQLSPLEHAFAGAVSGVISRALLQPMDVLKIRFQLQIEPTTRHGGGMYHGIIQSLRTIWKNEGPTALWKGHIPAQALSISYGIAQFWSLAVITKAVDGHDVPLGVCGGVAGMFGTFMSMPCDVLRTRMVAQGTPKYYKSLRDALVKMVKQEGVLSLWRGFIPTVAMNAPNAALIFYFYDTFLTLAENYRIFGYLPWLSYPVICGTAAGVCAKVVIYPLDVLKKRMQIKGFENERKQFGKVLEYTNVWSYIVTVTKEEGPRAWVKGLWPSMFKSGLSTGVIFAAYEATCQVLDFMHTKEEGKDGGNH